MEGGESSEGIDEDVDRGHHRGGGAVDHVPLFGLVFRPDLN